MEQWYRNFSVHLKGEPSKIVAIEQLIATLQTTQNLTRHQALLRIFEAGLQALAEDPSFASLDLKEAVELSRLFDLAKAKAARRREFRTIYQELGPEEILKVAKESGVGLDELLNEYRLVVVDTKRSELFGLWLAEHLSDGEEHAVEDIIEAASEDGLLADAENDAPRFELDVSLLRTVASRRGYSKGRRGFWRREE